MTADEVESDVNKLAPIIFKKHLICHKLMENIDINKKSLLIKTLVRDQVSAFTW